MATCKECGKQFDVIHRNKVFCGRICRATNYNKRVAIRGSGLPTATTGVISELVVACDLLRRGFEVFRAVSGACSCDLAVIKNGKLLRIEVKTSYKNKYTGKLIVPGHKKQNLDILAVVVNGSEVTYLPELEL